MARVVLSVIIRFKRRTRHCLPPCLKQCRFVQPLDGLDAGGVRRQTCVQLALLPGRQVAGLHSLSWATWVAILGRTLAAFAACRSSALWFWLAGRYDMASGGFSHSALTTFGKFLPHAAIMPMWRSGSSWA